MKKRKILALLTVLVMVCSAFSAVHCTAEESANILSNGSLEIVDADSSLPTGIVVKEQTGENVVVETVTDGANGNVLHVKTTADTDKVILYMQNSPDTTKFYYGALSLKGTAAKVSVTLVRNPGSTSPQAGMSGSAESFDTKGDWLRFMRTNQTAAYASYLGIRVTVEGISDLCLDNFALWPHETSLDENLIVNGDFEYVSELTGEVAYNAYKAAPGWGVADATHLYTLGTPNGNAAQNGNGCALVSGNDGRHVKQTVYGMEIGKVYKLTILHKNALVYNGTSVVSFGDQPVDMTQDTTYTKTADHGTLKKSDAYIRANATSAELKIKAPSGWSTYDDISLLPVETNAVIEKDGTEIEKLEDGKLDIRYTYVPEATETGTVTMLVILYDKSGAALRMEEAVISETKTIAVGSEPIVLTEELTVEDAENKEARILLWNSAAGMKKMADSITLSPAPAAE